MDEFLQLRLAEYSFDSNSTVLGGCRHCTIFNAEFLLEIRDEH